MSVNDVIKKSFLELGKFTTTITLESIINMVIALFVAFLFGLLITLTYSKYFRGVIYNRSFSIALVGMTVLSAMVTLAISTNIVISLGMVGALSIVRFRTAVKDPLDLLYLFWAITIGITLGAYMYPLAIAGSAVVIFTIAVMSRKSLSGKVYITIIHYKGDLAGDEIRTAMGRSNYRVKSKTLKGELREMAMEVFTKGDRMGFVEKLRAIEGVEDVTVIQYDGEYHE